MMRDLNQIAPVHALDIFDFVCRQHSAGHGSVLVVVTGTEGGGVRAPGALMAVSEDGASVGYVSNGCVDSDVCWVAKSCLEQSISKDIRYGLGSPFKDIRLPCGGQLDLRLIPIASYDMIRRVVSALQGRQRVTIAFPESGDIRIVDLGYTPRPKEYSFSYAPKPKLLILGTGIEPLYLARLASQADMHVRLMTSDATCHERAKALDIPTQDLTAQIDADAWTAIVLLFHDHDKEPELLRAALSTPAFYIGALGSRKTHTTRLEILKGLNVKSEQLERIRGPIGLIPSQRHAPSLAVSVLAEIMELYQILIRDVSCP